MELDPTWLAPKGNLADNLLRQNKLDEAMALVTASMAAGIDYQAIYRVGYLVSLLRDDAEGMAKYLGAARKTRDVLDMANWEPRAIAYRGRMTEGRDGTRGGGKETRGDRQQFNQSVHYRCEAARPESG